MTNEQHMEMARSVYGRAVALRIANIKTTVNDTATREEFEEVAALSMQAVISWDFLFGVEDDS